MNNKSKWQTLWCLLVIGIFLFSAFGHHLRIWIKSSISEPIEIILMAVALTAFSLVTIRWLMKIQGRTVALKQTFWILPALILIHVFIPSTLERVHFIFFGSLGFSSMLIFNPWIAVFNCALVSGLDELLQHYHPQRVGELRDVIINLIACSMGIWIALTGRREFFRPPATIKRKSSVVND